MVPDTEASSSRPSLFLSCLVGSPPTTVLFPYTTLFRSDHAYLACLDENLKYLLETFKPEFVFYQAGVDVLATDKLGRLSLTMEGCRARDAMVFNALYKEGIPVQVSMGGGYSPNISDIVNAHI